MEEGIKLYGLSNRQMLLADVLWSCKNLNQVNSFIRSLPSDRDRKDCETLIELMKQAVLDATVKECDDAAAALERIKHGSQL